MSIKKLLALAAMTLAPAAHAAPPLPPETIDTIGRALSLCTGGWTRGPQWVGPAELAPRLALLAQPSDGLSEQEGEDLYEIGKALLQPATGAPDWLLDGGSWLSCPARPREAVALLEYLAGEGPNDWRGYTNVFDLLGLAYETGAAGAPDPAKARRYYLRRRIHSGFGTGTRWSDGKDQDLLANVERAGLRPYLDALALNERYGGGARTILAEAALPGDPARARSLLLHADNLSLAQLIDWEEKGRIPLLADGSDVAIWAKAARTQMGYRSWIPRMVKAAELANGGTIPTAAARPAIAGLRPLLDTSHLDYVSATGTPIPARALVDRTGHAIHTEACRPASGESALTVANRLGVTRLYDPAKLPALPVARIAGRAAFGWVLLPAVQFQPGEDGKVAVTLTDTPAASCVLADSPPALVIPTVPRRD